MNWLKPRTREEATNQLLAVGVALCFIGMGVVAAVVLWAA